MPIYICGFIEVARDYGNGPEHWMPMSDIGCFGLLTGDICQILFGENKHGSNERWLPIAHRRGLPVDVVTPQAITAQEVASTLSASGLWGFTYIEFEEIQQISWDAYPEADLTELDLGWKQLFSMMEAIDCYFGYQRLVVWFEW